MQNEKQLTACQMLIEEMIKYELVPKGTHKDNVLFHKALATERQQHLDTFNEAINEGRPIDAETYFNQTFKTT